MAKKPNTIRQNSEKKQRRSDDDYRKRGRNVLTKSEVEAIRAQQGSGHS